MITNAGGREAPAAPNSEPQRQRILAVDYGRKRIGLALSDTLQITAQPLMTFTRTNRRNDLRQLREVCRKHEVARIVVGLPLHITGEAGEMAQEASAFAARVKRDLKIEVELLDERLTSWEARETLAETKSTSRGASGTSTRGKRAPVDDIAAAVLLRDYLELKRNNGVNTGAPTSRPERD
jgi:putative Holliday junction resolvase